ncbi:MAG TPA: putative metal-dependent hydrolase [Saprospiraceae bacterium]|nr:putative metal-dependent hydrolase [Saprospiraceae bacterium]HMQ82792.1 putative metal-dependent hydrolase [Saprospiraceae bacterium]
MDSLRYPIGRFKFDPEKARDVFIPYIIELPDQLSALVSEMSEKQLATPYRPEGWTGQQVVHHVADSHMNALIRFKWTLTEELPTIKPYLEAAWAQLPDVQLPVEISLQLLEALHARWGALLENMSEADWKRKLFHPESKREFTLEQMLQLYAWHGQHHMGHLKLILGA